MPWHRAEPEARAQEGKLGAEVGKAPDPRDLKTKFVAFRDIGKIDMRDPNVFRKSG